MLYCGLRNSNAAEDRMPCTATFVLGKREAQQYDVHMWVRACVCVCVCVCKTLTYIDALDDPTASSFPHGDTSKHEAGSSPTCLYRSMLSMPVLATSCHATTQHPWRLFISEYMSVGWVAGVAGVV